MTRLLLVCLTTLGLIFLWTTVKSGGAEKTAVTSHRGIPGKSTISFGEPWEGRHEHISRGAITITAGSPTGGSGVGAEYRITAGDPNDVVGDERPGVTRRGRR